jgi:hypothetical protein
MVYYEEHKDLPGSHVITSALKMEAVCFSETLKTTDKSVQNYNSQYQKLISSTPWEPQFIVHDFKAHKIRCFLYSIYKLHIHLLFTIYITCYVMFLLIINLLSNL